MYADSFFFPYFSFYLKKIQTSESHLRFTPQGHTSGSHLKDAPQGHTSGSYLRVVPTGHTPSSHLRVFSQGRTSRSYLWVLSQGRTSGSHLMVTPQSHTGLPSEFTGSVSGLKSELVHYLTASLLWSKVVPLRNAGMHICCKAIKSSRLPGGFSKPWLPQVRLMIFSTPAPFRPCATRTYPSHHSQTSAIFHTSSFQNTMKYCLVQTSLVILGTCLQDCLQQQQ